MTYSSMELDGKRHRIDTKGGMKK
jgi:hypothetical protein